ncbi:cocaine- and amphetamine-regulated transcript 4 [Syngnathoides biaculeatus]|uniref:cocaine- and amphetamine-regulated transcript 4 n=1 Tax=Syngnathoides biaculeatus TaxID=300417 RepID=UPI002ADE3AC3|nr:cocaine- and amphetamine-regulated transcript 4 [Syngnathoides biaculeatus]
MESVRFYRFLCVCLSLLTVLCRGQRLTADMQILSGPDGEKVLRLANNDLADWPQGFLDEAEARAGPSLEKKASVIPRCDVGERCAMKHGPRIGRLCDCLRGAACNTFFLRCY